MEDETDSIVSTDAGETFPLEVIPLYSTNLLTILDDDGVIQYESPSIERVFGYGQDELVGEQVGDYFHPEDRAEVQKAFETVVTSESYTVEAVEYRHRKADGSYRWVESIASTESTPDGQYVINTRDISEQKERERQLERFRHAVQATAHAVFITDTDSTIEYVNQAFTDITGYEREEAVGRTPRILKSGEMDEAYYDRLWETILAGEVWNEEVINRRKSGELYHAAQTISPISIDGDVSAFVAVQADITDRKEREEKLNRQNERLDQFAGVVSHDLRNPLNVASGRLELARRESDSEHLEEISRALDRMDTLIETLLTLANEGEQATTMNTVELEEISQCCWQTVATEDATLVTETDDRIKADRSRVKQLLENLIRNAVEHGSDDVTIRIGKTDDEAGFYVADDGPGIAEENREQVFTTGYSTDRDGNGLGLAIVEEIATAHGWDVRIVESSGGGTRVEITGIEFR